MDGCEPIVARFAGELGLAEEEVVGAFKEVAGELSLSDLIGEIPPRDKTASDGVAVAPQHQRREGTLGGALDGSGGSLARKRQGRECEEAEAEEPKDRF